MNTIPNNARDALYIVLDQIPEGRFTTYGRLADMMPVRTSARQVARLLGRLPEGTQLPWHRVVNSQFNQFKLANFGGQEEQVQRLKSEGLLPSATGRLPANKVWP
ncbi:MGMT family protein [Oceanospirillum maris]|uniref:MGMT family protein n=1 Tax=Oceanospirillum maris TaxID=64977 RepID=UPI00041B099E|nr:MGMT family protein [Oceanospirillum maris]